MAVTIKDVAEAAGVSISTVSYTLNHSGPVSEEKKQKIMEAVAAVAAYSMSVSHAPNCLKKELLLKLLSRM